MSPLKRLIREEGGVKRTIMVAIVGLGEGRFKDQNSREQNTKSKETTVPSTRRVISCSLNQLAIKVYNACLPSVFVQTCQTNKTMHIKNSRQIDGNPNVAICTPSVVRARLPSIPPPAVVGVPNLLTLSVQGEAYRDREDVVNSPAQG